MFFYGDYHTHTLYSDGRSRVKENIDSAIEKGLKELAFTDHGFNNPSIGGLTREKFLSQRREIALSQKEVGDKLKIYQGIEADLIGLDGSIDVKEEELSEMEILIVGYHSFAKAVSRKDWRKIYINSFLSGVITPSKETIARNTNALISSIKKNPVDIIAHINHLFKVDCYEVALAASDYGTLIELNVKHIEFPHEIFEKMLTTKVNFIANSDAHRFCDVGNFEKIEDYLKQHKGFDYKRLVNYEKKPEFARKRERIKEI